jgi:hypothetical protein
MFTATGIQVRSKSKVLTVQIKPVLVEIVKIYSCNCLKLLNSCDFSHDPSNPGLKEILNLTVKIITPQITTESK